MDVIIHSWWDQKYSMSVKGVPGKKKSIKSLNADITIEKHLYI